MKIEELTEDSFLYFHREEVPSPLAPEAEEKAREGLFRLIRSEGRRPGALNIIFCSDPYLQKIHFQYLHKEHLTDIITFGQEEEDRVSGDLFISTDRVKENAEIFQGSFEEELHRVMAHGVLHLLGYGDQTKLEAERMREMEEKGLRLMGF